MEHSILHYMWNSLYTERSIYIFFAVACKIFTFLKKYPDFTFRKQGNTFTLGSSLQKSRLSYEN